MSEDDAGSGRRRRRRPIALRWVNAANGTVHIPFQRPHPPEERLTGRDTDAEVVAGTATTVPTRRLCALVYVEDELRSDIADHLPTLGRRAWAPCYAVDLIALLWHSRRANRIVLHRDAGLCIVEIATIAIVGYTSFGLRPAGWIAGLVALTAVAVTRLVLLRRDISVRSILRNTWAYARREWQKFLRRAGLVLMVAAIAGVTVANHRAGRLSALVIVCGLVASWLVIVVGSAVAYSCASRIAAADLVEGKAEVLPVELVRRVRAISTGNVLVYARERARGPLGPFVGAGHRLVRWTTPPVDVAKARNKDTVAGTVDPVQLHEELAAAALSLHIETLQYEHRLYVDGRSLRTSPELLDRESRRPVTKVDKEEVFRRVREPDRFQRGYLCIRAAQADGDVVVTLFVRAILEKTLLQLEISVHALPEVTWPNTLDAEDLPLSEVNVPPGRLLAIWWGVKAGTRAYWPTVLGCLRRCVLAGAHPIGVLAGSVAERRAIANGQFDFGAEISLREHLALHQEMHYNAFVDMMAQSARLQRRLIDAVVDYLTSLGIDPGDFAGQSATIINNIQQNIINTMNAGGVTFGNNSPASGHVSTAPAPGQPPSQESK